MKYLLYDNLVRGAGLGHLMNCYNYGLDYSIRENMQWVPIRIRCGHYLGSSQHVIENELGLPIFEDSYRENIIKNHKYEHEKYNPKYSPASESTELTGKILKDWYTTSRKGLSNKFLSQDKVNICISIRRGDIAASPNHSMKDRLLPLSYYINMLEEIIKENSISKYRIILSTDLRGHRDCLVGMDNQPHSVEKIFKNHLSDLIFLPFCESDPDSNEYHTFDFFHTATASDFFIGSNSGFSHIIENYYRSK